MNRTISKTRNYFLYFVLYSVIGWCYEVVLEVFIYRWGFTNRGVLWGPYCPVYGFGMLIFLFTVYRLIKGKSIRQRTLYLPLVFISCALIATAVELVASYICELAFGSWPWQTYADYSINFQARIALSPSLRFGLGGAAMLYIIQPMLERLLAYAKGSILNITAAALAAAMAADCINTFVLK